MLYICEFELCTEGPSVHAVPRNGLEADIVGGNIDDAMARAAAWLIETVDRALLRGESLPSVALGSAPQCGGRIVALAVDRSQDDIPCMSAADAARSLGISRVRVKQLCDAGLLDSWKSGSRRLVTKASVEARHAWMDARGLESKTEAA